MTEVHPVTKAREEFFAAMGEAIAEWAWVEAQLFDICFRLIRPVNVSAFDAAMHTNLTFISRVGMTDAAATVMLSGADLDEWTRLRNKLQRMAKRRNVMVHSSVYTKPQLSPDKMVSLGRPTRDPKFLEEDFFQPRYTIKRVRENCASFRRLKTQLAEFSQRVFPR